MSDLYYRLHRPARPMPMPPAVLAIHGWGADENDLLGLAPLLDERLLLISPRGPLALDWGYGWYRFSPETGADATGFDEALARLASFAIDVSRRHQIDRERFFVLGFSQGAVMATALSLTLPREFRGAVLLSGRFPSARIEGRLDGFPVFLGHGRFDPLIPASSAMTLAEELRQRGADVTLRIDDYGHEVTAETLRDLNAWLQPFLPDAG